MTKYSDLESQDNGPQDNETKQLTTKKVITKETECNQEACWWCMVLCPIGVAVGVCILLALFILDQLEERDIIDDKNIVISQPWLNGTDIVLCSPDEPCEMTCEEYQEKSGNEISKCECSYLWTALSGLILGPCSFILLRELLKLCIGYICHPTEKKTEGKKKTTPKKVIIART